MATSAIGANLALIFSFGAARTKLTDCRRSA